MMVVNITNDVGIIDEAALPTAYIADGIHGATWAHHRARGWRRLPARAVVPEGETVTGRTFEDVDGDAATEVLTTRPTAEIAAESAAARVADFAPMIPRAVQLRTILRATYPTADSPEQDEAYAYQRIADDLMAMAFNPAASAEQKLQAVTAGVALKELYEALAPYSPTGKTFDLPWEALPE
jgi:hypothetical protein